MVEAKVNNDRHRGTEMVRAVAARKYAPKHVMSRSEPTLSRGSLKTFLNL